MMMPTATEKKEQHFFLFLYSAVLKFVFR